MANGISTCDTIVVVPCFNEARRLNLRAFAEYLESTSDVKILFADDGSTDGTSLLLEKLVEGFADRVSVHRLPRNCGKAEAVRRGVLTALCDAPALVGYWDADLATPLEAVDQFRSLLLRRAELTFVMGSRVALLGRHIKRNWGRHVAGRAFATAASLVLGIVVYDTQCGAKLFRATPETAALFQRPFRSRWVFDVEILARLAAATQNDGRQNVDEAIYEFPLDRWTDVRESRLKSSDFIRAAADLASIYWHDVRGHSKRIAPLPAVSLIERRQAA
jgi:dolichyl-phosphate beta-glucosyltransferase